MRNANGSVDYEVSHLGNEILAYLKQHPEAEDAREGIAEWWLVDRRIRPSVADVEVALRALVRNEFLVTRKCSDGRTYYKLNRSKEAEIFTHWMRYQLTAKTKVGPTERGS